MEKVEEYGRVEKLGQRVEKIKRVTTQNAEGC